MKLGGCKTKHINIRLPLMTRGFLGPPMQRLRKKLSDLFESQPQRTREASGLREISARKE